MHGLMLYDFDGNSQENVAFGNKGSIVETRTNNRIQPIHFGVNYHKSPLQFKLVFGSEKPLDRYDLEEIAAWLTGHQNYQWLTICQGDLERVQFRCLITELVPLAYGWLPVAFEATVVCDCPYAYSFPFEETRTISTTLTTPITFNNKGSAKEFLKPVLSFEPYSSTGTTLSIINTSDGNRKFSLDIPGKIDVEIDNNNGIILDKTNGSNLYSGFNMNFLRLVRGNNKLNVRGRGTLVISGRFLHNVGG